jgi:uncharacterized protein
MEQGESTAISVQQMPAKREIKRVGLIATSLVSVIILVLYYGFSHLLVYELSPWVMLAIFLAATASSIAGFAFSAICGAILFHILGKPVHVVEIMLMCSIGIQSISVVTLKNSINLQYLSRFIFGGLVGLPVGVYLLIHTSPLFYMKCMGVLLIIYGAYMLVRRPFVNRVTGALGDYVVGFLGGITGGFAAFPGAFVTIWCGLKGWSKNNQRGVYQPYILIMQVIGLLLIAGVQSSKSYQNGMDIQALSYVPAALLGTWCGISIFRRLTDLQFARSVNLLLIASGIGLVM